MENDLKFSGESPVVINYNGNAEDIYAPVRTSSADINIVTDKILDDLYSARKDEVCVRIEKSEERTLQNNPVVNQFGDWWYVGGGGHAVLIDVDGQEELYEIRQIRYKFIDKDNELNMLVTAYCDALGTTDTMWIVPNYSYSGVYMGAKFIKNNKWKLNFNPNTFVYDYYFYIGHNYYAGGNTSYSLKLYDSGHYNEWSVFKWENDDWVYVAPYKCSYGSTDFVFARMAEYVYQYADGETEVIFDASDTTYPANYTGVYSYSRSSTKAGFTHRNIRYTIEGTTTTARISGKNCHNLRVIENGEIKTIDVVLYNNQIYKINRQDRTISFYCGRPSDTTFTTVTCIFGDTYDNLYMVIGLGFYWLSPDGWVLTQNRGVVDYLWNYISSDGRSHYQFTYTNDSYISLHIKPTASIHYESTYVFTDYHTIWEGYKMPNTFSQELTLNLDSVQMTAIDPVSILKYVTIDRLLEKPKIVTYRELIGSALSYVMLSVNLLSVESSVSYGGVYDGTNGLLDLQVQVSNFWDESDKPATVYEMIEEILRPFCMVLAYEGDRYVIYNQNKTTGSRNFVNYEIGLDGSLTELVGATEQTYIHNIDTDWISNNVSNATMEINNTYEKVSGVASTMIPTYSTMAMDLIDYTQRDLYEADGLNVQTNKTKGIKKVGEVYSTDTSDKWFYIWNGVYVNPEYKLEPWSSPVDWYLNINKAYEYLTGTTTGYGADTGSILNFYGGTANPTATGKEQLIEKSVEVKRRITAYAADNGVPPEFLETADLAWTYSGSGSGSSSSTEGHISKSDSSDAKFGSGIEMGDSDRIIYRQKYEHINMTQTNNPVVDVDISRSFSRTGINTLISVMNNNTATNCSYSLIGSNLVGCDTNYYPPVWNSENIVVNSIYFKRYSAGSTIRCREIWDRRRIDMYITLSDGTYLQFNGKEWVSVSSVSENDDSNSFYLMRLMNNEYLFHTEQRYPVIETSDGEHFALGTESFIYFRDNLDHGVYDHDPGTSGEKMECPPYAGAGQIKNSSEGFISVNLPYVNDPEAAIYVDVYNSSMLGMTGSDTIGSAGPVPFYYPKKNESGYKEIWSCWCDFLPKNLTHIKAEHLDLSISVSTPESNLGQMFAESDVRYTIDSKNDYVEEYDGPSFRVNTFNQLVASSFSYLLFDNAYADPGQFIINGQAGRPECYVVQAYMNWLGTIRKIYNKTIKPLNDGKFSNIMTFIASPEIGENPLMVISDSWDLKTNRHTISSIEDQNIDVEYVMTVDAIELPRMARAERYNLPTAKKK